MSLLLFLLLFLVLVLIRFPLSLAMIVSVVTYALTNGINLTFYATRMFSSLHSFLLLAIPFFLLTSEVMERSGVSRRLFRFAQSLVGFIPGGLGLVNVVNSVIFSGMSGSAVADAGGIGRMSYQAMADEGYDDGFSMGLTAAAAVVGPIIPPSLPMVVFAMVANQSVARLFFGGVIPGLLIAGALMLYVVYVSVVREYPVDTGFTIRGLIVSFLQAIPPLLTPLILLGGIYLGVVTITEAAVLAVVYSSVLGFIVYRTLSLRDFFESLMSVARISGPILLLIVGSTLVGHVLALENVSARIASSITGLSTNWIVVFVLINFFFILLGTISDPLVNIMLFAPVFLPVARAVGIDPIHFGVVIVLNTMIGLITPPVGQLLVIISDFGKSSYGVMVREVRPFLVILLLVLLILVVFPQTVLLVPDLLFN